MCGTGEDAVLRKDCSDYMTWFWSNFIIDTVFIVDMWPYRDGTLDPQSPSRAAL